MFWLIDWLNEWILTAVIHFPYYIVIIWKKIIATADYCLHYNTAYILNHVVNFYQPKTFQTLTVQLRKYLNIISTTFYMTQYKCCVKKSAPTLQGANSWSQWAAKMATKMSVNNYPLHLEQRLLFGYLFVRDYDFCNTACWHSLPHVLLNNRQRRLVIHTNCNKNCKLLSHNQ